MNLRIPVLCSLIVLWLGGCATTPGGEREPGKLPGDYLADKTHAVDDDHFIGPQPEAGDFANLRANEVTRVINFRTPAEMEDLEFDEADLLAKLGIDYVNIPVGGDDYAYSPVQLEALDRALEGDGRVLLHCGSGWRASVFMVAWLVREQGMDLNEALAHAEGWWPLKLEDVLGTRFHLTEE